MRKQDQLSLDDRLVPGSGDGVSWHLLLFVLALAVVCGVAIGVLGGPATAILSAILAATAVALRDYRVGLWFMILLLPLSSTALIPRQMFGIPGLNPLNVIIAVTIVSLGLAWILRPKAFASCRIPYLWWFYVLPICLAALHGAFYSEEISAGFRRFDDDFNLNNVGGYLRAMLFKPAIILLATIITAIAVRNTRKLPGWIMAPVFVAAALFALILPIFILTISNHGLVLSVSAVKDPLRFGATIGAHTNEIGLLLNTAFALSLFTCMGIRKRVVKLMLVGLIGLISIAVALSFARASYIAWLTVLAYVIYTRRKFTWHLGIVTALLVVVAVLPAEIVERALWGIEERDINRISSGRVFDIWLPLLPVVLESPIFGHGLSSVLWSEPLRQGTMAAVGHTHSAYLGLILDLGIVGAALVWMFWFRLWQIFRALSRELSDPAWRGYFEGASVSILVLLVQGLTDDRFTPTFTQSFIWISAGIAFGLWGRSPTPVAGTPSGRMPTTR